MEKQISANGTMVAYTHTGTPAGEPVILMHGWGCDRRAMALFERVAAESHPVYNLDLPGFGLSPEPPHAWTVEDYTQMLEAFVNQLGLSAPILIGHSFGGRIAINYAADNAVTRLVLVDSAGIKPRRSLRYYLKVYGYKLAKKAYPLIYGKERAALMAAAARQKAGSADYNAASPLMRQVLVKAVNTDLKHRLHHIQAPTLLLWGEDDTATPLRDGQLMERRIPRARLVSFAGAGHFCFLDNPYQSGAAVRRFITPVS